MDKARVKWQSEISTLKKLNIQVYFLLKQAANIYF